MKFVMKMFLLLRSLWEDKKGYFIFLTVQIDPLMVPHRFFFCENSEETHGNVGL